MILQQEIQRLSADPNGSGIHPQKLPIYLAHLTISVDTVRMLSAIYHAEYQQAAKEQTIQVVTAPKLVDARGNEL